MVSGAAAAAVGSSRLENGQADPVPLYAAQNSNIFFSWTEYKAMTN